MQITKITGNKITQYNNFNEGNPYRLLMEIVNQSNWPIDMVTFTKWGSGLVAKLYSTKTQEIIIEY